LVLLLVTYKGKFSIYHRVLNWLIRMHKLMMVLRCLSISLRKRSLILRTLWLWRLHLTLRMCKYWIRTTRNLKRIWLTQSDVLMTEPSAMTKPKTISGIWLKVISISTLRRMVIQGPWYSLSTIREGIV
jgi:hypothetical protein